MMEFECTHDLREDLVVDEDVVKEIAFLSRSSVRVHILAALSQCGPMDKRDLKSSLDGVRTTIQRNLNALEERGWIERTADGYAITSCGRLVAATFTELLDRMSLALELRPAIRWLNLDEVGLEFHHLEEADITVADSANPYAPMDELVNLLRRATSVKAILPTLNRQLLEVCKRQGQAEGSTIDILVDSEAVERFRSDTAYADLFDDVVEHCSVYECDETLPYYLGLTSASVQLGSVDENSIARVVIELGDDDIQAWARSDFESRRKHATRLD